MYIFKNKIPTLQEPKIKTCQSEYLWFLVHNTSVIVISKLWNTLWDMKMLSNRENSAFVLWYRSDVQANVLGPIKKTWNTNIIKANNVRNLYKPAHHTNMSNLWKLIRLFVIINSKAGSSCECFHRGWKKRANTFKGGNSTPFCLQFLSHFPQCNLTSFNHISTHLKSNKNTTFPQ